MREPASGAGDPGDWYEQPEAEDEGDEVAARHKDTKLQTNYTSSELQRRLRNSHETFRTSLEEQGINILFLALGMLEWHEAEASEYPRKSPLVLVPVELFRTDVQHRFRIRFSDEDVGHNLSLQAKLKQDFGLELPSLSAEDINGIRPYFSRVSEVVDLPPYERWRVDNDSVVLGFFSFAKLLMFRDLDGESWPEESKPWEHAVLSSLYEGFAEQDPLFEEDQNVDDHVDPSELYNVKDADSSQLLSVLDVKAGRNLVVQGPPGTGKSQTITNLIAECLAADKTVLFVAEKMAALEVVKRRLDEVELGTACLELHSNKTSKRLVLDELKRTLELGKPVLKDAAEDYVSLKAARDRLNEYARAVNTPVGETATTPFQAYGHLARLEQAMKGHGLPKLKTDVFSDWTRSDHRKIREIVEDLQQLIKAIGTPQEHLFWGSKRLRLLPTETAGVQETLERALQALSDLDSMVKKLAEITGLEAPNDNTLLSQLLEGSSRILEGPDRSEFPWDNEAWLNQSEKIESGLNAGLKLKKRHEEFDPVLIPEAWKQEVLDLRQTVKHYGSKWWRSLYRSYREASQSLEGLCQGKPPSSGARQLELIEAILEVQRSEPILSENKALLEELFNEDIFPSADWEHLQETARWMNRLHRDIREHLLPRGILFSLASADRVRVRGSLKAATSKHDHYQGNLEKALRAIDLDESIRFDEGSFLDQPFKVQRQLLLEWNRSPDQLHDMVKFNRFVQKLSELQLHELEKIAASYSGPDDGLVCVLDRGWFTALLTQALTDCPALAEFDGAIHSGAIERFQRLDQEIIQHTRAVLAAKHWEHLPRHQAGGQLRVLQREFEKKRRHLPIRTLIEKAGKPIQAIKPVFMMSPLSIAKYIPPGSINFDCLIFDEASQIQPVDAYGAILRAKQSVVVGDSKQLPPTRFFDKLGEIEDADLEEDPASDLESILGQFCAQGALQRMLRWHYRSRHESLITVSNNEFYDNRLFLFPSPDLARDEAGLHFRHSPDTAYEPGSKRFNLGEAKIVAEAVMEHARTFPDLSLGVAAFSHAQSRAIDDQLEMLRREDSSTEFFSAAATRNPSLSRIWRTSRETRGP